MDPTSSGALTVRSSATATALGRWMRQPWPTVTGWFAGSALAAAGLLLGTFLVAEFAPADRSISLSVPPVSTGDLGSLALILGHNLSVLALHTMACVAGFLAGARMPEQARRLRGSRRLLHMSTARLAIGFVVLATVYSLVNQIWQLGTAAASVALQLHTSPALLLMALLPHAALELVAMFLPLAAWIMASRRRTWDELLAAALVTTGLAVPLLLVAASWETYGAPHLMTLMAGR